MKMIDRGFAWILLVLGCIHCAATFVVHKTLTLDAIWFFSAGLAVNFWRVAEPAAPCQAG